MAPDDRPPPSDDESSSEDDTDPEQAEDDVNTEEAAVGDESSDDAVSEDEPEPDAGDEPPAARKRLAARLPESWQDPLPLPKWLVTTGLGLLAVLLVATITSASLALTDDTRAAEDPGEEAGAVMVHDEFGRASPTLGEAPTGQEWDEVQGRWAAALEGAKITQPDGRLPSLAVVDLEDTDGMIRIRTNNTAAGMGMVVRFRYAANYLAILAAPDFGTWTVRRVTNGQATDLGGVGVANISNGVVVEARLRGNSIDVYIDGQYRATFTDPPQPDATRVGLIADPGTTNPLWGLFEAQNPASLTQGLAPAPTPGTTP